MDFELENEEVNSGKCPICGSNLEYDGLGNYVCLTCGVQEKDEYGRVREFLDRYGMARLSEISEATEVPLETIQRFIDEGRFDLVIHCAGCGIEIKHGIYCHACRRRTVDELNDAFEDNWKASNSGRSGKKASSQLVMKEAAMRYLKARTKE